MKVHSDSARVSALDTWLRDAEAAEATSTSASADTAAAATQVRAAPAERDTAEVLLGLGVWTDTPQASHQLVTTAVSPQQSGSSITSAQAWADHILAPLLEPV